MEHHVIFHSVFVVRLFLVGANSDKYFCMCIIYLINISNCNMISSCNKAIVAVIYELNPTTIGSKTSQCQLVSRANVQNIDAAQSHAFTTRAL